MSIAKTIIEKLGDDNAAKHQFAQQFGQDALLQLYREA